MTSARGSRTLDKDEPEGTRDPSSGDERPGRLGRYDKGSLRLQRWARGLSVAVWVAGSVFIATWICSILFGWVGAWSSSFLMALDPAALTAAVTVAGLAVTSFFVTAQLRVSGIARYGITELYRARELAPLLTAGIVCVFGFIAGMLAVAEKVIMLAAALSGLGLCALLFMQIVFVHLSLLAILYLDSVSMGRQFAKRVSVTDADEWGLLDLETSVVHDVLRVERLAIVSNRMNFGIRDPLMPFHELVVASRPKEFGQLVGVLLGRVLLEYGISWTPQAPIPEQWRLHPSPSVRPTRKTRAAVRRERRNTRQGQRSNRAIRLRLSLFLLIIHYLRRIHRNEQVLGTPPKARRDETQYQICRFIESLTIGPSDHKNDAYLPLESEQRAVIQICLYALLEISRDTIELSTDGKPEALYAVAAVARDLLDRRLWVTEAIFATDLLALVACYSNQLPKSSLVEIASRLSVSGGDQVLSDRFRENIDRAGELREPSFDIENPWTAWRERRA